MKINKILNFLPLILYLIIVSNTSYSNNHNNNLENIYKHLRNKQFTEAINKLKDLSEKNKPEAQLLYAKILYSGEIITQDFEMSYFWANTSKLGGLKKSLNIISKLNNLIDEENKLKINEKIKVFLNKSALAGDKLACLLYTSPSPRDGTKSRMPSSA